MSNPLEGRDMSHKNVCIYIYTHRYLCVCQQATPPKYPLWPLLGGISDTSKNNWGIARKVSGFQG